MEPNEDRSRLIDETFECHKEWIIKYLITDNRGPIVYAPIKPKLKVSDYPQHPNMYDVDVETFAYLEFRLRRFPTPFGSMNQIICEDRVLRTSVQPIKVTI